VGGNTVLATVVAASASRCDAPLEIYKFMPAEVLRGVPKKPRPQRMRVARSLSRWRSPLVQGFFTIKRDDTPEGAGGTRRLQLVVPST
jgi:hypothetical protein